ncbi:hypothetical protein BGZ70_009619 [Mortierella alpina]|uniref:Uncharacterized protein n=1 Tax=Mortierella alpina TaxID=64518 RepID=A0A9P6J0X9_MORAP|nr:hypothetical protein BGZ70_009619 [Mortierella alpina]
MKFTTPLFSSMALIAMLCTDANAQAENTVNNRGFGSDRFARFTSTVAMFTKNHTDYATQVYGDIATNAVVKHEIARELHVTYFGLWTSKHTLSTKQSAELGSAVQEKIKERIDTELKDNYLSGREREYTEEVLKSCPNRADNCVRMNACNIVSNAIESTVHYMTDVKNKVVHRVNNDIQDAIKAYGSKLFSLNLWVIKFQVKGDVKLIEHDIDVLLNAAPRRVKSLCKKNRKTEINAIKKNLF